MHVKLSGPFKIRYIIRLCVIFACINFPSDSLHSSAHLRLGRREAMTLNPKWVPRVLRFCYCIQHSRIHYKVFFVRDRRETIYFYLAGENMLCASDVNRAGFMEGGPFVHIRRCFSASRFKEKHGDFYLAALRWEHNMQRKRHFSFEPRGL
jgi:hypothetical protein